jgi:hypothetical protein
MPVHALAATQAWPVLILAGWTARGKYDKELQQLLDFLDQQRRKRRKGRKRN